MDKIVSYIYWRDCWDCGNTPSFIVLWSDGTWTRYKCPVELQGDKYMTSIKLYMDLGRMVFEKMNYETAYAFINDKFKGLIQLMKEWEES